MAPPPSAPTTGKGVLGVGARLWEAWAGPHAALTLNMAGVFPAAPAAPATPAAPPLCAAPPSLQPSPMRQTQATPPPLARPHPSRWRGKARTWLQQTGLDEERGAWLRRPDLVRLRKAWGPPTPPPHAACSSSPHPLPLLSPRLLPSQSRPAPSFRLRAVRTRQRAPPPLRAPACLKAPQTPLQEASPPCLDHPAQHLAPLTVPDPPSTWIYPGAALVRVHSQNLAQ